MEEIGLHNAIKQVKQSCWVFRACNLDNQNVKGEVWPWTCSTCPKCTSERKFSIAWAFVWTKTTVTLWVYPRSNRDCSPTGLQS